MQKKQLLALWDEAKALFVKGYEALDKEMVIAIPAVSFPAKNQKNDLGIGSPYGEDADDLFAFFGGVFHKILLTPTGEVFPPDYSPYTSSFGYNPLLIPLYNCPFIEKKMLEGVFDFAGNPLVIDYENVMKSFGMVLRKAYKNYLLQRQAGLRYAVEFSSKLDEFRKNHPFIAIDVAYYHFEEEDFAWFCQYLTANFVFNSSIPYIGDIQVKIPDSYAAAFPDLFLNEFSLGSPADNMSKSYRNWGFPVLNPDKIFTKGGRLGKAGKLLAHIFDDAFKQNKGGVRIDHFIGLVNPFVISENPKFESGRLYSSYNHPVLGKYVKKQIQDFAKIAWECVIKIAKSNRFSLDNIYIEDIGSRPENLDEVIRYLGLGRMLVSQFVNPYDNNHIYRLKFANHNDIAVLNTHDMESVNDFFQNMNEELRAKHLDILIQDLRFNYSRDLILPKNLVRMKWGELLASPAKRTMAFFTSVTGQKGRFNEVGNPVKWKLRMENDYKEKYFMRLKKGEAFNPFDAICLAIYARGDEFFRKNKTLVEKIRTLEKTFLDNIDC